MNTIYDVDYDMPRGSETYRRCSGCRRFRPLREFRHGSDQCRVCDPPAKTKRCRDCGIEKPIRDFHADPTSRDGRRSECRPCRNASKRATWRERVELMKVKPPPF